VQLIDCNVSCSFEDSNSPEIREMELMLLPAQDLPVGTSMSMGTHGSTTGKVMMLKICFDPIIMSITDTMMLTMILTMILTMTMILKLMSLSIQRISS